MNTFSNRVIKWHGKSGRKDLPWQIDKNPYKVWISEVMLQQTQVNTAMPYFNAFMERFPNIGILADSSIDDVLSYWSGLGYYARGRNIHKTACILKNDYSSSLPCSLIELESLPGIGRSTAGAIYSLGFNKSAPILDGNVKRVLSRHKRINGILKKTTTINKLWKISEELLPSKNHEIYTQGIMDLGATVCTRSNPNCSLCPVEQDCLARIHDEATLLPNRGPSKKKKEKEVFWLIPKDENDNVYLEKREEKGIWGGLWSFIESDGEEELNKIFKIKFRSNKSSIKKYKEIEHSFSHYDLKAKVFIVSLKGKPTTKTNTESIWTNSKELQSIGTPKPIQKLITEMSQHG
jgi:A/G-specific adenine glycosylase